MSTPSSGTRPSRLKAFDNDIVGLAGELFVHVETFADDFGGAGGVALNKSQSLDLGFEHALYLGAIVLDSFDCRAQTGERNGDVLRRLRQDRESLRV